MYTKCSELRQKYYDSKLDLDEFNALDKTFVRLNSRNIHKYYGRYAVISDCSGIDSRKIVQIVSNNSYKDQYNIEHYARRDREVGIKFIDGSINFMFYNRLEILNNYKGEQYP